MTFYDRGCVFSLYFFFWQHGDCDGTVFHTVCYARRDGDLTPSWALNCLHDGQRFATSPTAARWNGGTGQLDEWQPTLVSAAPSFRPRPFPLPAVANESTAKRSDERWSCLTRKKYIARVCVCVAPKNTPPPAFSCSCNFCYVRLSYFMAEILLRNHAVNNLFIFTPHPTVASRDTQRLRSSEIIDFSIFTGYSIRRIVCGFCECIRDARVYTCMYTINYRVHVYKITRLAHPYYVSESGFLNRISPYFATGRARSVVISISVCLFVCLLACLFLCSLA